MNSEAQIMEKFLRLPKVIEISGRSRSEIYRAMEKGDFPLARKDGSKTVWLASELDAWVRSRAAILPFADLGNRRTTASSPSVQ